jgi:phosphatidylglycerophosphatase A
MMPFLLAMSSVSATLAECAAVLLICSFIHLLCTFNTAHKGDSVPGRFCNGLIVWLARGFNSGLLPKGPGTWGSIVGIAWTMVLIVPARLEIFLIGMLLGIPASVWICDRAEKILNQHDPSSVVLDEIIALPICFFPWVMYLLYSEGRMPDISDFFFDKNLLGVLAIFGLFRLFDIWKPGPIGKIQKLPGGWGVTADDVLAGVATALIVAVFLALRHAV